MKQLLLLLLLPFHLFSQTAIDRLRSDSDVVQFVRAYTSLYIGQADPYWRNTGFDIFSKNRIVRKYYNAHELYFMDSLTARRWIVEDFNGDQLKDLVFYGRIGNLNGVYVFIPKNDSSGQFIQLTGSFANYWPNSIALLKKGEANCLILGSLVPQWDRDEKVPIRKRYYQDTLVYRFGWFIEQNQQPAAGPSFDSLHFSHEGGWSAGAHWWITIYKDGTAVYKRNRDSVTEKKEHIWFAEKFTTKIDDTQEWQALIDYMKFESLKDRYTIQSTDQPSNVTTVYFNNGKKKRISDYGMVGNFGLQNLYNKLYVLSQAGNWQFVKRASGWLWPGGDF